jgi:hypothetical protein
MGVDTLRGSPWRDGCGVAVDWRLIVEFATFWFPEIVTKTGFLAVPFIVYFSFSLLLVSFIYKCCVNMI